LNVHLNLIFGTTEGKLYTLRVPNAVDSAFAAPVVDSMDRIIDAGSVRTNRGDLATREGAALVRTTYETFDVN